MDQQTSSNVTWHHGHLDRKSRATLLKNPNKVFWLTGLSGSGKSTIAHALEKALHEQGISAYVLDGDNVRHGLNGDLGFTAEDRTENIRRIGHVAKLMHDAGLTVIASFISPHQESRDRVRSLIGEDFLEIHVDCSLEACEQRDPKGLYKKARSGEIPHFTGISAPYDVPAHPALVLRTDKQSVSECVISLLALIK